MERLARGEPPIIFGDGLQTMDMIHVRDVARANILAAVAPASDVASQRRQRDGDLAARPRAPALPRHGPAGARAGARGGARGEPGAAAPRRCLEGPRADRLRGDASPRGGHRRARRLVARREPRSPEPLHDPDHQAPARRGGSRRRRRGRALRLADARPAGRRASRTSSPPSPARRMPAPSPTAPRRCISRCSRVGVRPGDEVITVSHTFIACANAIRQCGATPVFVDIEPVGYNMDPALIAAAITPKTARHPLRAPDRHALRPGCDPGGRARPRAAGGRGRRLRLRLGDAVRRILASESAIRRATSSASRSIRARWSPSATAAC